MIVYHGSNVVVQKPNVKYSERNLDFGKGFYVTSIMGKVANDKVFRVVDMYKRGIWEKEKALKEIKVYETFDQIAFISQKVIDLMLSFKESYEVLL